jgi:diaminopimelate decarboxylase
MVQTAEMLLEVAEWIGRELKISFEFVNIGGGLAIPYRSEERPLALQDMSAGIFQAFAAFKARNGYGPKLFMESGRYMTGPHGVLVATAINHKDTYRKYIGVDACMSALMRPAMYGAYHHITVPRMKGTPETMTADMVCSLCENNDKFAILRRLPVVLSGVSAIMTL